MSIEALKEDILSDLQACLDVKWYRGRVALICVEFDRANQRYETIVWSVKRRSGAVVRTHYDDYENHTSTKTTIYNDCMKWAQLKKLIREIGKA